MDPITGIGLAAAVATLITCSIASVKAIQEVYRHGSAVKNSDAEYLATCLTNLTQSLQKSLQSPSPPSTALTTDEKDLIDLGRKCENSAQELQHELHKLHSQPRNSVLAATYRATRATWSRRKVEEISKQLEAYRSTLETSLLYRLRYVPHKAGGSFRFRDRSYTIFGSQASGYHGPAESSGFENLTISSFDDSEGAAKSERSESIAYHALTLLVKIS